MESHKSCHGVFWGACLILRWNLISINISVTVASLKILTMLTCSLIIEDHSLVHRINGYQCAENTNHFRLR